MESGKIIVVANQKGGVAKTSTVRNLSYALAEMGKKVLVVDFDPQYNLTTSFGVLPTQTPYNTGTLITNLLLDESLPDTNEFIQKIDSVDLIPSSRYLTVAEANLLMTPDSNGYLATLLAPLRMSYDYIIVDTNPSLGSLTMASFKSQVSRFWNTNSVAATDVPMRKATADSGTESAVAIFAATDFVITLTPFPISSSTRKVTKVGLFMPF